MKFGVFDHMDRAGDDLARQFDERLSVAVQTRVAGYVEHLAVRAPMEQVRKGQVLATVYAPDWLAPQNEFLALKRAGVGAELVDAARDRMRAMSIPESLIRQSEETGVAQARFTPDQDDISNSTGTNSPQPRSGEALIGMQRDTPNVQRSPRQFAATAASAPWFGAPAASDASSETEAPAPTPRRSVRRRRP